MHEADFVILADAGQTIQNVRGGQRLRLINQMHCVKHLIILVHVVDFRHANQLEEARLNGLV